MEGRELDGVGYCLYPWDNWDGWMEGEGGRWSWLLSISMGYWDGWLEGEGGGWSWLLSISMGYWDGWMEGADNRILNDESIGENRGRLVQGKYGLGWSGYDCEEWGPWEEGGGKGRMVLEGYNPIIIIKYLYKQRVGEEHYVSNH